MKISTVNSFKPKNVGDATSGWVESRRSLLARTAGSRRCIICVSCWGHSISDWHSSVSSALHPIETLPIKYCASRGPVLYAILYEDRRALCAWRAEKDDSIVRARV